MTHREATVLDCTVLAEMNHQLIRDEGHRNPMTVSELAERMCSWLAEHSYRAVLFEDECRPVAYALFRPEPDSSIYLRQFFVSRGRRHQGVGSQAVATLFREVFPVDARVTLDVLAHNDVGANFWAAVGFHHYSICLERFNTPIPAA